MSTHNAAFKSASPETPVWKVWAVRYATLPTQRSQVFLDGAPEDNGPSRLDYYTWILQSGDRTIVVDTGCRKEIAERRGRTYLRDPIEGLSALGIKADEVKEVVITHLHYDHAGNLEKYPSAQFYLQDREMQFATGRLMCAGPLFTGALEQEDVLTMVRTVFSKRVTFIDGVAEIAPGVNVFRIGGHTPGMQAVQVWTMRGWVVLASDAAHLYENINARRPFHIVANVDEMVEGWAAVKHMAASLDHVIPGHDPLVMEQYHLVDSRLDGIVALHNAPKFSALKN